MPSPRQQLKNFFAALKAWMRRSILKSCFFAVIVSTPTRLGCLRAIIIIRKLSRSPWSVDNTDSY